MPAKRDFTASLWARYAAIIASRSIDGTRSCPKRKRVLPGLATVIQWWIDRHQDSGSRSVRMKRLSGNRSSISSGIRHMFHGRSLKVR